MLRFIGDARREIHGQRRPDQQAERQTRAGSSQAAAADCRDDQSRREQDEREARVVEPGRPDHDAGHHSRHRPPRDTAHEPRAGERAPAEQRPVADERDEQPAAEGDRVVRRQQHLRLVAVEVVRQEGEQDRDHARRGRRDVESPECAVGANPGQREGRQEEQVGDHRPVRREHPQQPDDQEVEVVGPLREVVDLLTERRAQVTVRQEPPVLEDPLDEHEVELRVVDLRVPERHTEVRLPQLHRQTRAEQRERRACEKPGGPGSAPPRYGGRRRVAHPWECGRRVGSRRHGTAAG